MRKLKLQMHISVDGFVAGPNGELDWVTWAEDPELISFVVELTDSCDTMLIGRKMAEGFMQHWESVPPENPTFSFAKKMIDMRKIVFSHSQKTITGKNASITNEDLSTAVKKLKAEPGKDIIVYGGAGFVSSLIKEGLIDEFNFRVEPVMINKGLRIFDLLEHRQKLDLISVTPYAHGVHLARYGLKE